MPANKQQEAAVRAPSSAEHCMTQPFHRPRCPTTTQLERRSKDDVACRRDGVHEKTVVKKGFAFLVSQMMEISIATLARALGHPRVVNRAISNGARWIPTGGKLLFPSVCLITAFYRLLPSFHRLFAVKKKKELLSSLRAVCAPSDKSLPGC